MISESCSSSGREDLLSCLSCQQLRADICALEKMILLRPYHIERALSSSCILEELEEMVDASFTLADLIAFNDGAADHVARRYGSFGVQITESKQHWQIPGMFHRDLAHLWGRMSPASQHLLQHGMPIVQVLECAAAELAANNARKCLVEATFSFSGK